MSVEKTILPMSNETRGGSQITSVIFDYGLVLVPSPTPEDFLRMAEILGISFEKFYPLWENSRGAYDRGDITPEEYWLNLAAQTNSSLNPEQIEMLRQIEVEIWARPDPEMLAWLSALQTAGFKTALLSNMPLDLIDYISEHFQWMQKFNFKTFSAAVRLIKPDPAIYEYTLRGLGVPAAEALFIDDREPNIRAARTIGMQAIQFRTIAELKNDLQEMRFPIMPTISGLAASAESSAKTPTEEIKFQL
jgi:putative hydrolase of the HAD superfamily